MAARDGILQPLRAAPPPVQRHGDLEHQGDRGAPGIVPPPVPGESVSANHTLGSFFESANHTLSHFFVSANHTLSPFFESAHHTLSPLFESANHTLSPFFESANHSLRLDIVSQSRAAAGVPPPPVFDESILANHTFGLI